MYQKRIFIFHFSLTFFFYSNIYLKLSLTSINLNRPFLLVDKKFSLSNIEKFLKLDSIIPKCNSWSVEYWQTVLPIVNNSIMF
ncbi:hypothetical protein BpHYR1_021075 [Brachionus plicatilis]|uniref:Uncharacterized protein n=1 Tax=Brachionus plicatilis TaxID=10195 RepID=A0A3M7PEL6_BRAPC|nr:hypothetical protein BpHYR1_021075 [Brachionus plicatilis]